MRPFALTLAVLCLLPASRGHAQGSDELGNPELTLPPARRLYRPERTVSGGRVLTHAQAQRQRLRRERLREALGDLLGLSHNQLEQERAHIGRQLELSGSLTAIGVTGIAGGLMMAFIPMECRASTGWFNFGPTCDADGGWLAAGLITAGVSAITMIVSAIWLSRVDRRRRLVERAMRPNPLALDLRVDEHGAIGTAAVRF